MSGFGNIGKKLNFGFANNNKNKNPNIPNIKRSLFGNTSNTKKRPRNYNNNYFTKKTKKNIDCNDIFFNGYPSKMDFLNDHYKITFSCKLKNEDGKSIQIKEPDDKSAITNYVKSLPTYDENTLTEDGLYTWILYSMGNNTPIYFAAIPVKNAFELGTAHKSLAFIKDAKRVHGAGELKKEGNTITYNLLSGTYTLELKKLCAKKILGVKKLDPKNKDYLKNEIDKLINSEFTRRFPNKFLNIDDSTMINDKIPVKKEDLDAYEEAGFKIELYDSENECNATKGGRRKKTRKNGRVHTRVF